MLQDTQQKIIDSAIIIFNDDFSAPIEKVADKAEVTRRTLHRYFGERKDLLLACQLEMQKTCRAGMLAAFESSPDLLVKLEQMLYACIDCGSKYSFFNKLHHQQGHIHDHENEECANYDHSFGLITTVISGLQEEGLVSRQLTVEWMSSLFTGIIRSTIDSLTSGTVASASIKKFAWFSFSKGIGA